MKILLSILFVSHSTWAQVLLIPDSKIDFEKYRLNCQKEGYTCTMPYFLQKAQQDGSPRFDELLNQLDYSSETFKSQFLSQYYLILKEDSLSLEQAEILLKIIQQLSQFERLEKQLEELIGLVKSSEISELTAHYQIVLKKPVSDMFKKNWRPEYFKVKVFNVAFNKSIDNFDLVDGECEKARLHPSLQVSKWQIDSKKHCGFAEHFAVATNIVKENKTGFVATGLILIGAAIFINQYEVKFTF